MAGVSIAINKIPVEFGQKKDIFHRLINERRNVLKFYSQIKTKPNAVIKQIKDGSKIVESKCICIFQNGVLETNDPEIIAELEKHPNLFRTDKPFADFIDWQETEEGQKIVQKAQSLGIDTRHARKHYLEDAIMEKEMELNKEKEKPVQPKEVELSYKEIVAQAKEAGIPTHKRKKEEILEDLLKRK